MVQWKTIIFSITFMILLSTFAFSDYDKEGGSNQFFNNDPGLFDIGKTTSQTGIRALSEGRNMPLVTDLDNDNQSEIIVLDGNTVRLFHNRSLLTLSSQSTGLNDNYSNMITHQIDDDPEKEIILVGIQSRHVIILEWDGSSFSKEYNFSLNTVDTQNISSGNAAGDITIACEAEDKCMMLLSTLMQIDGAGRVIAFWFNASEAGAHTVLDQTSAAFCHPNIRRGVVADVDRDGINETIFSYGRMILASPRNAIVQYLNFNSSEVTSTPEVKQTSSGSRIFYTLSTQRCDVDNLGSAISSPTVFNTDTSGESDLETLIAFQRHTAASIAINEGFKIFSFNSDSTFLDDFPEIVSGDSTLVSNVMKMNSFVDTGSGTANPCSDGSDRCDFCAMGYEESSNELNLICGSSLTAELFQAQTDIFTFDLSDGNFTMPTIEGYSRRVAVHASQQSSRVNPGGDNQNLDEVITSFGIFQLNYIGDNHLDVIFTSPRQNGTVIMDDAEGVGNSDMIYLTTNNLFYIDDQFVNSPGQITDYTIRPCVSDESGNPQVWKQNITPQIFVQVSDVNDDRVFASTELYFEQENQQKFNFSDEPLASGTVFPFTNFSANKTTTNGRLRISGFDEKNPSDPNIIDFVFAVGDNGVDVDDCESQMSIPLNVTGIGENVTVASGELDPNDNAIRNTVVNLADISGIGVTVFWLILMAVMAFVIFQGSHELAVRHRTSVNIMATIGLIIIIDGIMLIIGTLLGFVPFGILLTIVVLGLVGGGVALNRFVNLSE